MTILLFIAVLFTLILVHEWGHFIVAKKTGMRVDEFGIGFPPKLFGIKKNGTEYTINLFPIGGFVRIFGEDAHDAEASPDFERSFVAKPKWAQALVLIAGVTMNVLFAWFLFFAAFMIGVPTAVSEADATENARLVVADVVEESPAVGKIPREAIITSVRTEENTLAELTPSALSTFIAEAAGEDLTVTYTKGDEESNVTITPAAGLIEEEPERAAIGIATALVDTRSMSLGSSLREATSMTWRTLVAIVTGVYSLIAQTFTGSADYSQIAGPVGIVGLVGDAAAFGITALLMFTALISLNLAVINMLPFPALDGGRLMFVAVETVTRRRIDPIWVLRLNAFGFILLIALMVAVTYNDIVRIL